MKQGKPDAKGVAIMLYISSKEDGDRLYEERIKRFGFPRNRYPNAERYADYHVTIGYIKAVKRRDLEDIQGHLTQAIEEEVQLEGMVFEYGALSLLGPPLRPFIVAIPMNVDDFRKCNRVVYEGLKGLKKGKYQLEPTMRPKRYIPHMNLYGQIEKTVEAGEIPKVFAGLDKSLRGVKIPLTRVKIY